MKNRISISLFFASLMVCFCVGILVGCNVNKYDYTTQHQINNELSESDIAKKHDNIIVYEETTVPVTIQEDKINADTVYMILEKDIDTGNVSVSRSKIPQKYIGMTREQLMNHLEIYESNPPLDELEKGFISIELISFSTGQVEVQRNYETIKPLGVFYIMVYDHKIVVMLEDKKTVFLSTEINVSELPSEVQQDVMRGLFIPNEVALYDFLETYTS